MGFSLGVIEGAERTGAGLGMEDATTLPAVATALAAGLVGADFDAIVVFRLSSLVRLARATIRMRKHRKLLGILSFFLLSCQLLQCNGLVLSRNCTIVKRNRKGKI